MDEKRCGGDREKDEDEIVAYEYSNHASDTDFGKVKATIVNRAQQRSKNPKNGRDGQRLGFRSLGPIVHCAEFLFPNLV